MKSKRQNPNLATKPGKEPKLSRAQRPPTYHRWLGSAACAASSVVSRLSGLKTWAANRFSRSSGSAIPFRNPAIAWQFEAGDQAAISVHALIMPPANWAPASTSNSRFSGWKQSGARRRRLHAATSQHSPSSICVTMASVACIFAPERIARRRCARLPPVCSTPNATGCCRGALWRAGAFHGHGVEVRSRVPYL